MGVSKLAIAVAVMLMVVVSERPAAVDGALTCGQVTGSLGQCIGYLTKGGAPPPACCSGVVSLNSKARTTPDRKQACNCLKSLAASIKGLNYGNAASLPGKCNVKIPYAISPSTDCNKVT